MCVGVRGARLALRLRREHLVNTTAYIQDGAKLNIAASGVLGWCCDDTYFDVCIFNPHTLTKRHDYLSLCYKKNDMSKRESMSKELERWNMPISPH